MIKSMTGFGRSKYENDSREYLVEIKSVNNRFNDVNIKIPRAIGFLEEKIKKVITNSVSRGKIDVFISFTNNSERGKSIKINTDLAKLYVREIKKLAEDANIIDNVSVMEVTKLPEVFSIKLEEDDEELLWCELDICLKEAINNFIQMRTNEGEKIYKDLVERIETINSKIEKISTISTGLVDEYIVKLEKRIKDILKTNVVDETRLAQEVVIYSDKCSVEEEITRLKSHISQFLQLLDSNVAIGKKIDFLIQEMNRETNTIGSKANNLEITNLVVDIKTEIENIREQIQNIE